MSKENKIYAAYGSNLNLEQMRFRCPYALALGPGLLYDYQLLFRGNWGAVATVEPGKGFVVPVLLWEITPRDEESLDRYEGWPHLYHKETVSVLFEEKQIDAMAYIMNTEGRKLGVPGRMYLDTISAGYLSAGFDRSVLREAVQVSIRNMIIRK